MTRVHALIPAHNEQERLPAAIRSLLCQTVPPSRITVVSDRSTDGTVEIAKSFGGIVDVMETEGNRHRKSGALNQALARLDIPEDTAVLVMDADSQVVPSWLETALPVLAQPDVGAVGGIFLADGTVPGLVSELESLEYHRYAREVARDGATARVLTGTSTLVMRSTLTEVAQARADGRLPGAGTYHVDALTEDFELTLAIRHLGYRCLSPKGCQVRTETMGAISPLWRQRVRWQRGAIQALGMYGVSRVTMPYIVRQVETGVGLLAIVLLWSLTVWGLVSGVFVAHPFWLAIGAVFLTERIVTGWRSGWKGRVLASTVVFDFAFDLMIGATYVWVVVQTATRQRMTWGQASLDAERQ